MKHEIEIPEGYKFSHIAPPILSNGGGVISVILEKQPTKGFDWYVDEYLNDSVCTSEILTNWIPDSNLHTLISHLHKRQFNKIPWEIKIGLFRFICDKGKADWVSQYELYSQLGALDGFPKEFIDDLFKYKN